MNTRQKDTGFTLIEVVISIGVLAIGLLGLASLQATAMKLGKGALLRSQATSLAYSIVDAMLANRTAAFVGNYNHNFPADPSDIECTGSLSLPTDTIANRDLREWENALACTLPQGTGEIIRNGTQVTVTVEWNDSNGTEERQKFVVVTDIGQ